MITPLCQRWVSGRHAWRPAGELFTPAAFEVAPMASAAEARAFVKAHHYSGSCSSTVRLHGLYARGGALVGVAVFSSPQADAVLRPWTRKTALELGRLVLLDAVPGNAESWFVRRALDAIRPLTLPVTDHGPLFAPPVTRRGAVGIDAQAAYIEHMHERMADAEARRAARALDATTPLRPRRPGPAEETDGPLFTARTEPHGAAR